MVSYRFRNKRMCLAYGSLLHHYLETYLQRKSFIPTCRQLYSTQEQCHDAVLVMAGNDRKE